MLGKVGRSFGNEPDSIPWLIFLGSSFNLGVQALGIHHAQTSTPVTSPDGLPPNVDARHAWLAPSFARPFPD